MRGGDSRLGIAQDASRAGHRMSDLQLATSTTTETENAMNELPEETQNESPIDIIECYNCANTNDEFVLCLHCRKFYCKDCYCDHLGDC